MKHLLFLSAFLLFSVTRLLSNEPDSVWIKAYSTEKNNHKNGLHFAWSLDKENWCAIGDEHGFLRCDYGSWGSGKRMLNPTLLRDKTGLWHCIWEVNETGNVFAHSASEDLVDWRRQSYGLNEDRQAMTASLRLQTNDAPNVFRVAWSVVNKLIATQQLAEYRNRLWSEQAKDDSIRFAGLKPVEATISVDFTCSKKISDKLIGIFFEDINYAADGGLYAELIQNRDFEYDPADKNGRDQSWNATQAWTVNGGKSITIDTLAPIHPNNKHYIVLSDGDRLINEGFDGIPVISGEKYRFSVVARSPQKGKIIVRLIDKNGESVSLDKEYAVQSSEWEKHDLIILSERTEQNARLEITAVGEIDLDMVSLFPQKTFKGRENGLRADLAQLIADIHPRFVRFPGGCVAHGDGLENMYRWKNTIGALESRMPQRNIWGYHQTVGLGYFEYFQFCEDIGAEPLPVVPAGVPCQNSEAHGHPLAGQQGGIPMNEMDEYVQEVLDLIEWANGDVCTAWGKKRAEAGHPAPFNLKYIGIGNEDLITDVFEERFAMIFNAVKEKHPEITVIGTVGPFFEGADYREGWDIAAKLGVPMVDEHYYNPPGWFIYNQDYYDKYDRAKSKVYLGEYAAHLPGRPNNLETALAEALYLTALERNGDVVAMSSYAPLLAKEGHTNWNPNLIYFDNMEVKPTVGYQVQKLYGNNVGDEYLTSNIKLNNSGDKVRKRVTCSVVRDSQTNDVIIKLVNLLPVEVSASMHPENAGMLHPSASKTVLTGKPADKRLQPKTEPVTVGKEFSLVLPAYSFTVVRIQTQ
jgi:alpha-L-arabinofuranosidase